MTEVILVNTNDEQIGTMEKIEAHKNAMLHRAFSVFIFNEKGEMLLHKRAANKYHSSGLWTNACCSHPLPGEDVATAAARRLQEEMGFIAPIQKAFHFVYKADFDNGLTEHEFDHVFIGTYSGKIVPDVNEVSDYCFKSVEEIKSGIQTHPQNYTAWFKIALPKVEEYLTAKSSS